MRQIDRQALVSCTPEQMYALVDDIASYPKFLPWCRSAKVITRTADEVVASLQVHKGPLHVQFTTRNRLQPPQSIGLELVAGPFRALSGEWRFTAVVNQGAANHGTRVSLRLSFAFANPFNAWLLEPVFEHTCNSLIDAFVRRARDIHG